MSLFLRNVLTALPYLGGMAANYSVSPTGVASASCGLMQADAAKKQLSYNHAPVGPTNSVTYTMVVDQGALATLEFSDWPSTGCCDIAAIVLGDFFPFEDSTTMRLPWGAVPAALKPPTRVTVMFSGTGILTLSTDFETHTHNLAAKAKAGSHITACVCLRSAVQLDNTIAGKNYIAENGGKCADWVK